MAIIGSIEDIFSSIGDIISTIINTLIDVVDFIPKIFKTLNNFLSFIPNEILVMMTTALVFISAVFIYRFVR